jgi:hypothetical protein
MTSADRGYRESEAQGNMELHFPIGFRCISGSFPDFSKRPDLTCHLGSQSYECPKEIDLTGKTMVALNQQSKAIRKAMVQHDDFVVEMKYRDRKGKLTTRVVSPIRFMGKDRFLALCLCREEPRMFCMDYCEDVRLQPAWNYVMPVDMSELETN